MLSVQSPLKTIKDLACLSVLSGVLVACGGGGGGTDPRTGTGTGTGTDTDDTTTLPVVVAIGNGTGDSFVEGVARADETSLQAGASTLITVNLVDTNSSNAGISTSYSVAFASDCVSNGLASFDNASVDTVSGLASATYTANGCSGDDEITATASVEGSSLVATVTVNIEVDQVLAVEFVSVEPSTLALAGIGGDETSVVTFRLIGEQSAPIIGEEVRFSTSTSAGGISLADGAETDVTNNDGLVTTVLQSGTIATSVEVIAEHAATGIKASSGDITISTGVPVANRLSLSLDSYNPDAFNHDGVEINFSVIASDVFGNNIPDGTQISFASPEAGKIDSSCTLVDGQCSGVAWISADPRPANGIVSMLAHTSGAEDFDDLNGNNVYDGADNFDLAGDQDLAEAFVDENENGIYDLGEFFVDANSNGVRDLADGTWNGPCLSGIDASAICSATDSVVISESITFVMSSHSSVVFDSGDFGAPGSNLALTLNAGNSFGGLILSDINGNSMPGGTTVTFSVEAITGEVKTSGLTGYTIASDTITPNGAFGVTLVPEEAGSGILTMTIALAGHVDQVYTWNLTF